MSSQAEMKERLAKFLADGPVAQGRTAASRMKFMTFVGAIPEQIKKENLNKAYAEFAEDLLTNDWIAKAGLALCKDKDRKWDASAARKRVAKWAGGPDKDKISWSKYAKAFLVVESPKDSFGSYRYPFADIVDGRLVAIYAGCKAAYAALRGARGGGTGPGVQGAIAKVKRYLRAFGDKNLDEKK